MSQQTGARGQLETLLVRRTPLRVYNPRTRPYTHRGYTSRGTRYNQDRDTQVLCAICSRPR